MLHGPTYNNLTKVFFFSLGTWTKHDTTTLKKNLVEYKNKKLSTVVYLIKGKIENNNLEREKHLAVHELQNEIEIQHVIYTELETVKFLLRLRWIILTSVLCLAYWWLFVTNRDLSLLSIPVEQVNLSKLNPLIKEPIEAKRVVKKKIILTMTLNGFVKLP